MNTAIFNPAQANYLFRHGAKIYNIIQGEYGEMGVLFDRNDPKVAQLLLEWKNMARERKKNKK